MTVVQTDLPTRAEGTGGDFRDLKGLRGLDIGAGMERSEGWVTLDIAGDPDVVWDIRQMPWPFEDGEFDRINCHHVLEHLEPQFKVPVFNEMWRVLKTDGSVNIEVPVFPYVSAVADPTHLSYWHPETFDYFLKCERDHDHDAKVIDSHAYWTGEKKDRKGKIRRFGIVCHESHRLLYGIKPWRMMGRFRIKDGSICQVFLDKVSE